MNGEKYHYRRIKQGNHLYTRIWDADGKVKHTERWKPQRNTHIIAAEKYSEWKKEKFILPPPPPPPPPPPGKNRAYDELVVYMMDSHNHHVYLLEIEFREIVLPPDVSLDDIAEACRSVLTNYILGNMELSKYHDIQAKAVVGRLQIGWQSEHGTTLAPTQTAEGRIVKRTANTLGEWYSDNVTVRLW